MMVIFLVGLVSMILMRTLRKDYARYSREEDLDDLVGVAWGEESHECDLLWDSAGLYGEILRSGTNLGYLKKRGGGAQLQAVSGGALEDNVKKLIW